MIDLEQKVETVWVGGTKKYYIDKGYLFTKIGDKFMVKIGDLKKKSTVKVPVKCDFCHKDLQLIYEDYNNSIERNGFYQCKACAMKHNYDKRNPNRVEINYGKFLDFCNKYNYEPISTIEDFTTVKAPLYFECKKHGIKSMILDNITSNSLGCEQCIYEMLSETKKNDQSTIVDAVESKNNNKLLNPEDYINSSTNNLIIRCGSCGNVFTTSLSSIRSGSGRCHACKLKEIGEKNKLTYDELKKRFPTLINPEDYVDVMELNMKFPCVDCGEIFITGLKYYQYDNKIRCSKCSNFQSNGERKIENILKKYNITFIPEKRFPDCRDKKTLPFDFYLPDFSYIIEFDGQHHYQPIYGQERFEKTQIHDQIKNKYCDDNNIKLIRIPYWDGNNMEEIIIRELKLDNFTKIQYIPYNLRT